MDNNETSHAYLDSNDAGMSIHSAEGALEHESHALAKEHVNRGVSESDFYPGGYTLRQAFGRLILGDLLRNGEQKVEALADEEDVESVYSFMESGKLYWTHRTIQGSMNNQRFFITKIGLIGIGHIDI
ncbi:HET-domain-containing protein [Venturia nashicola]|uniref:HET-domain-containing protein n=1 Tax=Venturia nashicola TaxID=86259 RepID=A0A4Z1P335_9PEZI|nr:HET-domain-containing protein [Venturia nashicola]